MKNFFQCSLTYLQTFHAWKITLSLQRAKRPSIMYKEGLSSVSAARSWNTNLCFPHVDCNKSEIWNEIDNEWYMTSMLTGISFIKVSSISDDKLRYLLHSPNQFRSPNKDMWIEQARKLDRCDSYLRNLKTLPTHWPTGVGVRRCSCI